MITIIAVGKKHEDWIVSGIERYQKRLKQPFDVEWVLLPHSSLEGMQARTEESERILAKLDDAAHVLLLDETGKKLDSPTLATLFETKFAQSKKVSIVIGGAYGVDTRLKDRADEIISLSDMVFPHQLVRLMLIEQIYRAQEITRGGRYHHE